MRVVITRKEAMNEFGIKPAVWRRARTQGAIRPAMMGVYKRSPYFFLDQVRTVLGVKQDKIGGART